MVEYFELRRAFDLSPAEGKLMGRLYAEQVVTSRSMDFCTVKSAKTLVHLLRKKLKPHGISIGSRVNLGYWLEQPDKERVAAVLKSFPGQGEGAEEASPALSPGTAASDGGS